MSRRGASCAAASQHTADGFLALLSQRGVDLEYGRSLPRLLRALGLSEVSADAYFPVALPASAALDRANINQVRDVLVAQGLATPEEIAEHLATIDAGQLDIATPPLISAWGRQGAAPSSNEK